jgi:Zn-dependent M28 family amino/carboxypeptidase
MEADAMDPIADIIHQVDPERIRRDLSYLCELPLPFRKANLTLPDHIKSTLDETDDFLVQRLSRLRYAPWKEEARAQAFGYDATKPRHHTYATPHPGAPWYSLHNVYAEKKGQDVPAEIILFVAHKDSQSWIHSPGAYDNAVGTAALLELARVLAKYTPRRTIRFLWCNEEHCPWTSITAAANAKKRGDNLIAVINVDSIGGKSQAEIDQGKKPNVTLYTTEEGKRLADRVTRANELYRVGLEQRTQLRSQPGDDDGSFVKAGYPAAIANLGSFPYADPNYHEPGDTNDKVDVPNVSMAAQAVLAAALITDRDGAA